MFHTVGAARVCQRLSSERLLLDPALESHTHTNPATGNRYLRVHAAPGTLALFYEVVVDLMHRRSDPAQPEEVPIGRLPFEVLWCLYPSRYCQSDRPTVRAQAVEDAAQGLVRPHHCADVLSTDSGPAPTPPGS